MIYAGAATSGAHYNPAVTVALLLIRKIGPIDAIFYMISQFLGGFTAGIIVAVLNIETTCGCPNGMSITNNVVEYNVVQGFVMELIGAWFLMFVIMGTAVDDRAPA